MRTKKTFINLLTDVIPLIISSLLGIFKLKLFIQILGDETLGLYQLFTQIMVYVALVDGGIGNALLCSLYKPNKEKNNKKISSILSASKRTFSLIGAIIFTIAFLISFLVPFFIKDTSFSNSFITITFLLFAISNVISYFFVPYQTILEVKEKKYVANIALQIGQIVQSALEIILLLCGVSFINILCMHSVVKLLANLAILIVAKKMYPELNYKEKERDYSFLKQLKDLIFHKINGLIGSNIDVLIITYILGLKAVAIYSTYNYIINMLKEILNKLSTSMLAIIGNKLVENEKTSYSLFKELRGMLFYIATIITTPLLFAIDPFIEIWYEGNIQTDFLIAIGFCMIMFIFVVKICINLFVNARGLFKETKKCAITDTIVNLSLSIILAHFIGIPGAIIATAISVFVAEYCMKTSVIYKEIFKKKVSSFHLENIKFFVIFILDIMIGYFITNQFTLTNIFMWFLYFIIFTLLNAFILLIVYKLIGETKFINRIKELKKVKK